MMRLLATMLMACSGRLALRRSTSSFRRSCHCLSCSRYRVTAAFSSSVITCRFRAMGRVSFLQYLDDHLSILWKTVTAESAHKHSCVRRRSWDGLRSQAR